MFKKSLIVAVLVSMMSVNVVAEEVEEAPMEGPVTKCDTLFDACIEKCGDDNAEACMDKCQEQAEKCDLENAPTN
jgi:hypothetical protein